MKKLLITLLLAVLSTSAMAEWVLINDNDIATNYVNPATIRKAGNKVRMWSMDDYKTMQITGEYKYISMKTQIEYDCQNETFTSVALLSFSGNMGSGQVVLSTYQRLDPIPVSPESIGELAWKVACRKR